MTELQTEAVKPVKAPELVLRGKVLTHAAVAIFVGLQATMILLARPGASSTGPSPLRLIVFALMGYMATRGRQWARWLIAILAVLQLVVFALGFIRSSAEAGLEGFVFGAVLLASYAVAAYLLIGSRPVSAFFSVHQGER